MLGLCWTPASVQGMQKVAASMPSNPEQLLGAILVRKDIFNRFETTMYDTCLDANNLLEYLFSLYNSTAAPAERENLPSPHGLGIIRKDTLYKKGIGRGQHIFPSQPVIAGSQLPQTNFQGRPPDVRAHQAGLLEGHRKKIKIDQPHFQGSVNVAVQHQDYSQSVSMKPYDNHSVYPAVSNNQIPTNKMNSSSEVESHHAQSVSSLPPFSQICRQGSRPYSPATAQYSDALTTPHHKDGHKNLNLSIRSDCSNSDVKIKVEGVLPGVLGNQQAQKNILNSPKPAKKLKFIGSGALSTDGNNSNNGERTGRKKKSHQCFCGALFTRADNLKRHIRKCHEEKLSGTTLDFDVDNSGAPVADDFSHAFPSSAQEGMDRCQVQDSQGSQQLQVQQRQHHEDHHHVQDNDVMKSVPGVKWSCFCGESFDDHRHLVEHTRTHDNNT